MVNLSMGFLAPLAIIMDFMEWNIVVVLFLALELLVPLDNLLRLMGPLPLMLLKNNLQIVLLVLLKLLLNLTKQWVVSV